MEVLSSVFISSEESGMEQTENGAQSVLHVKPLKWRSPCVSKLFKQLDHKIDKMKSKRGKQQTLPHCPGNVSSRTKPITEYMPNHWGFGTQ